ncbi:chromosomal replication initiator protein DnaA [Thermocatellispora tengchongensis]|uniref:hypothetical protein n=1 Tax=Thermocatellispora tengchongensis TaxID=1073253 RepID=UPI003638C54B
MEVLVAVLAFAGALLSAIATGALVGRFRSEPTGWLGAWAAATAALCVSLGVVAIGHLVGFGATTFRLYQMSGSLVAPLWTAIGLVQLLARKTPVKFLAWLWGGAFTFVALVILTLDPVSKESDLGKVLPTASDHWGTPPTYLLVCGHVAVVLIMLGSLAVAAKRWRNGDEYDTDNLHASLVLAPAALALVAAMRFADSGIFTTALLVVLAAAVWYSVLRPLAPYEDDDEDDEIEGESGGWNRGPRQDRLVAGAKTPEPAAPPGGRRRAPEPVPVTTASAMDSGGPPSQPGRPVREGRRRSGLGDLVAEYRAGEQEVDYAARMQPGPDDPFGRRGDQQGRPDDPFARPEEPHGRPDDLFARREEPHGRPDDPFARRGDQQGQGRPDDLFARRDGFAGDDDSFGGPATGYIMDADPQMFANGARPAASGAALAAGQRGLGGPETGAHARIDTGAHARPEGRRARPEQEFGMPGTGVMYPGAELTGGPGGPGGLAATAVRAAGGPRPASTAC